MNNVLLWYMGQEKNKKAPLDMVSQAADKNTINADFLRLSLADLLQPTSAVRPNHAKPATSANHQQLLMQACYLFRNAYSK